MLKTIISKRGERTIAYKNTFVTQNAVNKTFFIRKNLCVNVAAPKIISANLNTPDTTSKSNPAALKIT